jgi:hypothetical protein
VNGFGDSVYSRVPLGLISIVVTIEEKDPGHRNLHSFNALYVTHHGRVSCAEE